MGIQAREDRLDCPDKSAYQGRDKLYQGNDNPGTAGVIFDRCGSGKADFSQPINEWDLGEPDGRNLTRSNA
jgi:hypothetical protein